MTGRVSGMVFTGRGRGTSWVWVSRKVLSIGITEGSGVHRNSGDGISNHGSTLETGRRSTDKVYKNSEWLSLGPLLLRK